MNDKTHTADDLARAKFAQHPDGRIAARLDDDVLPWITTTDCYGDTEMANAGWSPVRECPDPEQHATGRPLTPDAITDEMVERVWQVWCELPPRDMHSLRIALTAALTEPPKRPEGAEDIERLTWERDEARATKDMHKRRADEERARAEKAEKERDEARTVTDAMVERARNAPSFDGRLSPTHRLVREMLTAALTEPPARPEGAERWEDFLIDSLDYQALTDQQITDLADRIAEEMNR